MSLSQTLKEVKYDRHLLVKSWPEKPWKSLDQTPEGVKIWLALAAGQVSTGQTSEEIKLDQDLGTVKCNKKPWSVRFELKTSEALEEPQTYSWGVKT